MRRWLVAVVMVAAVGTAGLAGGLAIGGSGSLGAIGVSAASAQQGAPLYVAGAGFSFEQAAERALAQNPNSRFFLLVVNDAVRYLTLTAPAAMVEERNAVARSEVVFLICQRELDSGRYRPHEFIPGVVAARGWPPPGSSALPAGTKYYADEDPANLPDSAEALRRLRSTCS